MRYELYANDHDGLKWTILVSAAQANSIPSIQQVPMLRPDDGRVGNLAIDPRSAADVAAFFLSEHTAFTTGVARDLNRIVGLTANVAGRGVGVTAPHPLTVYTNGGAVPYFAGVIASLNARPGDQRDVVFLDPDSGIAGADPGGNHVRVDSITDVWATLRSGDLLAVYQAYQDPDHLGARIGAFEQAIGAAQHHRVHVDYVGAPAHLVVAPLLIMGQVFVADFGGPQVRVAFLVARKF